MKPKGFELEKLFKLALLSSTGALFITGIIFILLKSFFYTENDFGITPSPYLPITLMIHGLMAPVFLMIFGALFPAHISRAFKAKANLTSGLIITSTSFLLISTGYALYYSGNETLRNIFSLTHSGVGALFGLMLIKHILAGKKYMKDKRRHE